MQGGAPWAHLWKDCKNEFIAHLNKLSQLPLQLIQVKQLEMDTLQSNTGIWLYGRLEEDEVEEIVMEEMVAKNEAEKMAEEEKVVVAEEVIDLSLEE